MANLLRTEWYKLWHSWYFWGIGIFTFLLSSILLLDSKGKTSNLVMTSLYNTPLLYFLIIVFIALFIGNDLGGRTLNAYLTAGHKRGYVLKCLTRFEVFPLLSSNNILLKRNVKIPIPQKYQLCHNLYHSVLRRFAIFCPLLFYSGNNLPMYHPIQKAR